MPDAVRYDNTQILPARGRLAMSVVGSIARESISGRKHQLGSRSRHERRLAGFAASSIGKPSRATRLETRHGGVATEAAQRSRLADRDP